MFTTSTNRMWHGSLKTSKKKAAGRQKGDTHCVLHSAQSAGDRIREFGSRSKNGKSKTICSITCSYVNQASIHNVHFKQHKCCVLYTLCISI